ncbi:hypothetical protein LTS10_006118 [Elasticomyces elasticus]|nr:hypothetical protein LTS10_006118 [Elasticomyces elasticus]
MGSNARVAYFAPSPLAPYISLPSVYGGSTGYYSGTTINGTSTWERTAKAGYTPAIITPLTTYKRTPTTPVILLPDLVPAPSTARVIPLTEYWATVGSKTSSWPIPTTPTISSSPTTVAEVLSHVGMAAGAIAGIVVASLACTVLAVLSVLCWRRKKRTPQQQRGSTRFPALDRMLSSSPAIATKDAHAGNPASEAHRRQAPHQSMWTNWTVGTVHLAAPTVMIAALLCGFLFALGHHLLYRGLAGRAVADQDWVALGASVSTQQINIAAGTALAFLAKASLVLAVSTAYTQAFWRAAKVQESKKIMTLTQLDAAYSALDNLLSVFTSPHWLRNPLLVSVALTAWLIPIAAIVTPATLSVHSAPVTPTPSKAVYVPNLDLRSLAFSATIAGTGLSDGQTQYTYNGPSLAVQRVVGATALQGSILPISAPNPNATWTSTFTGPSLRCSSVQDDDMDKIKRNIANHTFTSKNCYTPPVYLSWLEADSTLPFPSGTAEAASAPATYIALIPSLLRPSTEAPWNAAACGFVSKLSDARGWTSPLVPAGVDDNTVLQCKLIEAEYHVDFDFINGAQNVNVSTTETGQELRYTKQFYSNATFDDGFLRQLSYQSVLYAFNSWILGSISSGLSEQIPLIVNSSIMSTILLQAKEMAYLAPQQADTTTQSVYRATLQQVLGDSNGTTYAGLMPPDTPTTSQSLAAMIEELFSNITISLMSSAELQPNPLSATAPPPTNNTYFYSPLKLWLAYGLAIAFAAISMFLGLACIHFNQASYSNSYSTLLRTSRGAELSVEISEKDAEGASPLPSSIAGATVKFSSRKRTGERSAEGGSETILLKGHEPKQPTAQSALIENGSNG